MLARVMTFYSESRVSMKDVVESMRSDLPPDYASLPGFRGLLVLEKPGDRNQVIAVTLWHDEEGVAASEELADTIADRIAGATGTSVSRNIYNVVGRIGIAGRRTEST